MSNSKEKGNRRTVPQNQIVRIEGPERAASPQNVPESVTIDKMEVPGDGGTSSVLESPKIESPGVELSTSAPASLNKDDRITKQIADAVDRGLDPKKWVVAIIKFIGRRQALFLLAGIGSAWALTYSGLLPVKGVPKSKAEAALDRFRIESIESRDDTNAAPPTEFIAIQKRINKAT